jgi:hypothetical protein
MKFQLTYTAVREFEIPENATDEEYDAMKEVIMAGMDGSICFLDLEDGSPTRPGIRNGCPMQSTPSVHPVGIPYMNVGQSVRKTETDAAGAIGLHQYNLYNQEELKLIDGLDIGLYRA